MAEVTVIFGLGFTGKALARRLRASEIEVFAPVRGIERFGDMKDIGVRLVEWNMDEPAHMNLPRRSGIAWLIPPIADPERSQLRGMAEMLEPQRVVYVSSTGVYGDIAAVDEATPAAPNDDRGRLRIEEEDWMCTHSWSALVLRAAAIYGPHRGVHAAVREGRIPRGSGSGIVSRIHVDDLAALIHAGLDSPIEGRWPVADEEPCSSDEIIQWCEKLLAVTARKSNSDTGATPGRRVDGRKICELLKIRLKYASWRTGVPASLGEETGPR